MARGLPRTSLSASALVRTLEELAVADPADTRQSFGERVGQWLDFKDAITLYSVLNGGAGGAARPPAGASSRARAALQDELARVRNTLAEAIQADGLLDPGRTTKKLHPAAMPGSTEGTADFVPCHRYYLAHQRNMSTSIGTLRAQARVVLAEHSPSLKRLAALDGVLEQALGARERSLLATLPQLLSRRFEQLFEMHRRALIDAQAPDDPDQWLQPGGWLATFCRDMHGVLMAELELRLQPVLGLVEALGKEVTE